ncbi:protein inscuteable homolog isoform X2 [Strongylocentrotus purpuratus]|nr:protein inscuteable homolog isoform X2 [Strongylocentrotus purpuratus]XP_030844372.1 protein inscuteable homolog isoform X2 [Strongylocentrotus purpuratus]
MEESPIGYRGLFPFRCDVDSVQQWLIDIRLMPEQECTTVMETKPIHNSPLNLENLAATVKESVYRLQSIKDGLFSDLSQIYINHKEGISSQFRPLILSLNIRIKAGLGECSKLCPELQNMEQKQQEIIDEMRNLIRSFDMCLDISDQSVKLFIQSLTTVAKAIKAYLEMVQGALVRKLVDMVQGAATELNVKFAVLTVHSLAQDGVWLRRLLIQEDTMRALLAICRITTFSIRSIPMTALEIVSILCTEVEGRAELEKVGGVGALSEILASPITLEAVKKEAASVLAEITSPDADIFHRMLCFIEHMEDLLRNLTVLCDQTSSPGVFLVATTAIANITFMDAMASDYLAEFQTAEVLIQGYLKGKAPSIYSKHQVITIIANISCSKSCREQIVSSGGMNILAELLQGVPSTSRPTSLSRKLSFDGNVSLGQMGEESAYEDIYQKAATALGRLCQDYETCKMAVDLKVVARLADLCKHARERNHRSDVLVACLAALRRIHSHIGSSPLKENDVEQLIQPRLMESFLHCSTTVRRETFV